MSGLRHRHSVLALLVRTSLFAAALVASSSADAQRKDETFQSSAPFAILIDGDGGSVLYERNADQLMPPSSMVKLMTAEVVFNEIRQGRLKLDDEFTVSENAWRRGGAPSGGSTMYAVLRSRIRVEDLLRGVIVQSGNDASIVLAEGIAGSEAKFAQMMNTRAKDIGLTRSHFTNSHGLPDPKQHVTARELARIAQHIVRTYPDFYTYYSEREFTWNKIRQQNRNPLLALNIGADGLKTGATSEAGFGLAGSAVQNGLRLIVIVNGHKTAKDRADDARRLLEWGFRNFEARMLFAEGQIVADAKVYGGEKGRVSLIAPNAIRIMVPRGVNERIIARVVYSGPVPVPIAKGQPIGKLRIWRGEQVALEVPLQAADDVAAGSLTQRAIDAAGELLIALFRAGAERL